MSSQRFLPDFVRRLQGRIKSRSDTEFQQAMIRFIIGCIGYLYFGTNWVVHTEFIHSNIHLVALSFISCIHPDPGRNSAESSCRTLAAGIGMPCGFLSRLVSSCWLAARPSRPVVGNLFVGHARQRIQIWHALSVSFDADLRRLGFGSVLAFNPFWHRHLPLGMGIWLTLVVVPLYASHLADAAARSGSIATTRPARPNRISSPT